MLLASVHLTRGQSSVSFFSLGNVTYQNSFYNPAMIPEGRVFLGLPVLSGVHLNFNNKFSYSDFIVPEGVNNRVDLNRMVSSLQRNNMVSTSVNLSLLHLGFTNPSGLHVSFFANERIEMDFLYHRSLFEFAIDGSATVVGEKIKIGKTRFSARYFREIGLGLALPVPDQKMNVGLKLKYLQGFANASTPGSFRATIEQDPVDFSLDVDMENAELRTSGFDVLQGNSGSMGSHLAFNANRGVALDLGFTKDLNRYYAISASLTDLGFISWKEDIKNHHYGDTSLVYRGINLDDPGNIEEAIKDSLINRFKNKKSENSDPYTTMLSPRAYFSWVYHTPLAGDVVASFGTRFVQTEFKYLFGVGYRHSFGKFFTGTVNVTKLPQQFLNLGAAIAVKGGPAQLYLAVDHLVNFDLTKFQAVDVRFGINFIFGKSGPKESKSVFEDQKGAGPRKPQSVSASYFLGSKVKVKGQEGIYTIIKKQEPRDRKEFRSKPRKEKTKRKKNLRGQRNH